MTIQNAKFHKKILNPKSEIRNPKQCSKFKCSNDQTNKDKQYDLEDRTYEFAKRCRDYVKKLPKTISNIEYGKLSLIHISEPTRPY